jgi:ABC-type multidrug transport system fused ATPase/permease subunit
MNSKYFEYIIIYSSVLLACILLGTVARMFVINIGADEFTAGIVFCLVTLFGVLIYAILAFLIDGLFFSIVRTFFRKKKHSSLSNKKSNISEKLEEIRTVQQLLKDKNEQGKKDIAIKYIQKEFAAYCSDEDLHLLCQYVIFYAEKKSLVNIKPITTNGLSNLDFYHFGWNIWKYFRVSKQEDVSFLLKSVFANYLKDVGTDTIKSHLKDDELKGIIKIRKSISEQ